MRAFILAGGFATRLWPLTEKRAKPLLPLAGKPMITHIVEGLPKDMPVIVSTNDAFAKIPADTLKTVLADKATLTKILTGHVIAGKLSPAQLAGDHKTLAGSMVTVKGSGEAFTVGKENANVICGNVSTANATVYIIDSVLMP